MSGKADSAADAERKITAAINKANHGNTKLSMSVMGTADVVASQNITVVGMGRLSGKYFIDSIAEKIAKAVIAALVGFLFAKLGLV